MSQATLLSPSAPADCPSASASPREFAAYVLSEIERCNGPQLPCYQAEPILEGFLSRFPENATAICAQAFGAYSGMWRGAPVTVLRFQEGHDHFFALPLLEEVLAVRADHL